MLLLPAGAALLAAGAAHAAAQDTWAVPPNLHYAQDASWRGVDADGTVRGFDVSGHSTVIPGVHDFIRLVPGTPLAHGAIFSRQPLKAKEWIAEIAFRVHGPPATGLAEMDENGHQKRLHKGGRGLAFWATKSGLPGPATISSDPSVKVSPPPPAVPETRSSTDADVSLFGGRTSFDGLGVIFDSAPTAPVWRRSDPRNLIGDAEHETWGVGATGVVSGVIDDATQKWLDSERGSGPEGEEEAAYLDKAFGECEAAFRNAQGLLWARIAHFNHTVRVDLDLSPHTTLAKAGRHYEHNCFSLEGVTLPVGTFVGISGLASGNTEPDVVDVYAMDVFEILPNGDADAAHPVVTDEPVEEVLAEPLEGTSSEAVPILTHEIFVSQARMVEAIDDLARKVESVQNVVSDLARRGSVNPFAGIVPLTSQVGGQGSADAASSAHLASLDARLSTILSTLQSRDASSQPGGLDVHDALVRIQQLSDQVLLEVQSVAHKLDQSSTQSSASSSVLQAKTGELVNLARQAEERALELATKGDWSKWLWMVGGVGAGFALTRWKDSRKRDDVWDERKFL
ncbi:uncharacterized protein RHOBADRAFT_53651 [Rhodotorula graminis WP1]|uniref:Uncharacterized protein n=1 Tax=Rhodotorula graminis (strain WP1) TaxID=578459 RepID=A0A194S2E9_RHOGW|nr:uncharacterized protein RHOBADRAFT_53651 [Rhodotorula graminis WP1]KPV74695.1 hypothetical protein RHOBADRAFT_53651 [Rhodotorula graminis WP1]